MDKNNTQNSEWELVEQLFRSYYKVLRAYAFRLTNDQDVAEDIVQDVFVAICNKRETINNDSGVKNYLFRSVYNKALNYLTSKKQTNEESLDQTISRLDLMQSADSNHENIFLMKELQKEIDSYLERQPVQMRKIFILSRYHGLKVKEVAQELELSPKTVEKYLAKVLREVWEHLRQQELLTMALFLLLPC